VAPVEKEERDEDDEFGGQGGHGGFNGPGRVDAMSPTGITEDGVRDPSEHRRSITIGSSLDTRVSIVRILVRQSRPVTRFPMTKG
jgi:hypothetical protein